MLKSMKNNVESGIGRVKVEFFRRCRWSWRCIAERWAVNYRAWVGVVFV